MNQDLAAAVAKRGAILFAGAGISATLGVPTWKGLIDFMAAELGYDPRVLAPHGANYLTLAEYYRLKKKNEGISALCEKMANEWNADEEKLRALKVFRMLHDLNFPIVYTTNYDQNLENAFRLFGGDPVVVTDVTEFPSTPAADQTIVKFHGDLRSPDSLVLTEQDYFRRLEFESPLDIRLRSDVLSRSILFVGYSLSDINMRLLLYKLSQMWSSSTGTTRPRSFLLLQRPNEMERTVLGSWGIDVLTQDSDEPGHMLSDFLENLQNKVGEVSASHQS